MSRESPGDERTAPSPRSHKSHCGPTPLTPSLHSKTPMPDLSHQRPPIPAVATPVAPYPTQKVHGTFAQGARMVVAQQVPHPPATGAGAPQSPRVGRSMLTISKLRRWSINYYIDTAAAAEHAARDLARAGGGLAEYYSERETRTPAWLLAGDTHQTPAQYLRLRPVVQAQASGPARNINSDIAKGHAVVVDALVGVTGDEDVVGHLGHCRAQESPLVRAEVLCFVDDDVAIRLVGYCFQQSGCFRGGWSRGSRRCAGRASSRIPISPATLRPADFNNARTPFYPNWFYCLVEALAAAALFATAL